MKQTLPISIARHTAVKLTAALAALLISTFALAADTLESKQIEQWIEAMPEMQAWGKKNEAALMEHQNRENLLPESTEEMVKPIKDAGLYDEAEALVKKYGFDSPEQFSDISLQLISAMASIKMAGEDSVSLAELQKEMESSKAQLEASPLPAAQKQAMLNQMQQAQKMYERMQNVPEADKAAVKPYMEQIEAVSGS